MIDKPKTVEQYLTEKGEYVAATSGFSMYPLLKDKQYAVKIIPVNGQLKKYDVVLFRRGTQLVLHRVVKVCPDRCYIRGDNCENGEWVADSQIVGVLAEIIGKDKRIRMTDLSYVLYSRLNVFFFPCRRLMRKAGRRLRRCRRKHS